MEQALDIAFPGETSTSSSGRQRDVTLQKLELGFPGLSVLPKRLSLLLRISLRISTTRKKQFGGDPTPEQYLAQATLVLMAARFKNSLPYS